MTTGESARPDSGPIDTTREPPLPLVFELELPRWDLAWETRVRRSDRKLIRERPVWDALRGNPRITNRYARNRAVQQVRETVAWLAKAAKIPTGRFLAVTLVYAPGDNRDRDEDNLFPLLKPCADALCRGRRDWVGLALVPTDTPRHMSKSVVIEPPPHSAGLWLRIEIMP